MNVLKFKRSTTMWGIMISTLEVGCRPIIFHQGQYIMTEPVIKIHDVSDERVCFETEDTIYTLMGGPRPRVTFGWRQFASAA